MHGLQGIWKLVSVIFLFVCFLKKLKLKFITRLLSQKMEHFIHSEIMQEENCLFVHIFPDTNCILSE